VSLFRPVFAVLLAVALTAGAGACSRSGESGATRSTGEAAIGGPFQMVDQHGQPVNQGLLKGKWSAVFFGYTFCPEACPTTLQTLAAAQDRLGPKAKDLQIVFVSIDPARDTPEKLNAYLSSQGFPKGVVGLTGSPEQVARVAKAYKIYYAKSGEGPDYLMDHSTMTFLMNPQGKFDRVIAYGMSPDDVADQIRKAMSGK
jgi:protein SCO1/2